MAIYHFSAQIISRSTGRSSVSSAAYRSGEKIEDERTGINYDYTRKKGVVHSEIIAPECAPIWVKDRTTLWNEVERIEKRKDAQLAREINIALPKELSYEQKLQLTRRFVIDNFSSKGMIADISIHETKNQNPHVHIMLTTREIQNEGFGLKNREWNDTNLLEEWRKCWAEYANNALELAGHKEKIDHRSLYQQGIERIPQIHIGAAACSIEKKKGIETERGNINRKVKETNKKLQDIKEQKVVLMNQYKYLKNQLDNTNKFFKKFNPEERSRILDAQKVLKAQRVFPKYVCKESLEEAYKRINKSISFWNGLDEKLTKKMKNLEEANFILSELKACREKYKEAPLFSEDRRNLKNKISDLQDKFNNKIDFIERYKNYGIKDEKSFEVKYSQLSNEETIKRQKYNNSIEMLLVRKDILEKAETAINTAEGRRFMIMYPEYRNIKNSNVAYINSVNDMLGRKLSYGEFIELGERARLLKQENNRLSTAKGYLDRYENLNTISETYENGIGKFKRVFNKNMDIEYRSIQQEMKNIRETLNNEYFRIRDIDDYNRQKKSINDQMGNITLKEVKNKENEISDKEYELVRYELRYNEAKSVYDELQGYKQQLKNDNIKDKDISNIKSEISLLQYKFKSCRVGSEDNFIQNYQMAIEKINDKRRLLQEERNNMFDNINIDTTCDQIIKASNAFIEVNNEKFRNEYYHKGYDKKVVNETEYRARTDETSDRRNSEIVGRTGGISTERNRYIESAPSQYGRHNNSIPERVSNKFGENSQGIQSDSREDKRVNNINPGQISKEQSRATNADTTGNAGIREYQQKSFSVDKSKDDRRESTEENKNVFKAKADGSKFISTFNRTNNSYNKATLDQEMAKQIQNQKRELEKMQREDGNNKEKTNTSSKAKENER